MLNQTKLSWQTFSQAIAPERGAFPMDLDGVCGSTVRDYIACVRFNKGETMRCRDLAQLYLACRMDHGLMEKDSFSNLGFASKDQPPKILTQDQTQPQLKTPPASSGSGSQ
ncbi:hypothetical protein BASA61_000909 [Batrachochytrium salamandrivorans]|nr:hypothetical protein BASA62_004064 [Batrachochytrium salamandrivorans]KAH6602647.1 hypothetical protein BASA61_000909 [Batrachochytrium salamandrivorans]KAH9276548.1 hypothetical protein BASA83_000676 [Batrachochytrium salamandrivorans]